MPLWYVNPAKKTKARKGEYVIRKGKKIYGAAAAAVLGMKRRAAGGKRRKARKNPASYGIGHRFAKRTGAKRMAAARRMAKSIGAKRATVHGAAPAPGRRSGPAKYTIKRSRSTAARRRRARAAVRKTYAHTVYGPTRKKRRKVRRAASKRSAARRVTRKRKGSAMAKKRKRKSTRARRRRKTVGAKVTRRKRRKGVARSASRRRKSRRKVKSNPARRRRRRRSGRRASARRNPSRKRRSGRGRRRSSRRAVPALRRARRAIKRARRRRGGAAYNYVRRHRMRSNAGGGLVSVMMGAVKQAASVAVALYGTRFLINTLGYRIPMIDRLGAFAKPAVAIGAVVGAHYGTRKGPLAKYRTAIMLGVGLNLIDTLVGAFAPASVKGMFGLAGDGVYDRAIMGDYVEVGDYLKIGDYIEVGAEQDLGLEQEMGLEQELGALEQDLGDEDSEHPLSRPLLGGVPQSAFMRPVGRRQMVAAIPERSFVSDVPTVGQGFDNEDRLYAGVFAGGFGN
jgi:hypothetical protein